MYYKISKDNSSVTFSFLLISSEVNWDQRRLLTSLQFYIWSLEVLGLGLAGKRHLVCCVSSRPTFTSLNICVYISPRIAANSHVCQILTVDSKVQDCPTIEKRKEKVKTGYLIYLLSCNNPRLVSWCVSFCNEWMFPLGRKKNMLMDWLILTRL